MVAYSFKKRFIAPIQVGLGIYRGDPETALRAAWPAAKRQTIRAIGKRRHARVGDTLQLYTAMRTKQCKLIGKARCTAVRDIVITFGKLSGISVEWDDGSFEYPGLDAFAQRDGFANWSEMVQFWDKEHGLSVFTGKLIQWESL